MIHYPHYITDFNTKTRHLTRLERSIYRDLMDIYYETELPLTKDIKKLCRLILATSNEESTAVEQVLNEFFTDSENGWFHGRCFDEINKYQTQTTQKSIAGRASAAKKAEKRRLAIIGKSNEISTAVETPYNGTSTNQNQNQNHINTIVISDANDFALKTEKNNCPHQEIIDLYHKILPSCPRIREWTPARATQLRARWNEDPMRQNLAYWRQFFEYVATCDFLVGKAGNKPFFASLEWIVKMANFTKIREENYANRA